MVERRHPYKTKAVCSSQISETNKKTNMAKESISATVEKKTADGVREIAKKEKRSFSQMVDLLLQKALSAFEGK